MSWMPAAVPTRELLHMHDLDGRFQIAGRRRYDFEPWDYTMPMTLPSEQLAWHRAIKANALIVHHMRHGEGWLLIARLARGVPLGSVRPNAPQWRQEPPTEAKTAYRALGRVKGPHAVPAPLQAGA